MSKECSESSESGDATMKHVESFDQAFSKACGSLGQGPKSRAAAREIPASSPAAGEPSVSLSSSSKTGEPSAPLCPSPNSPKTGNSCATIASPVLGEAFSHRAALRRALFLLLGYALVLLFALGPVLLLGQNISLPLLDWLDGDITGKVLLGRNLASLGDYFAPQVPQMMQGAAMWSNAPSTLLYAWLSPFLAYGVECFLTVTAAYWGMALFLRRMLALVMGGAAHHAAHPAQANPANGAYTRAADSAPVSAMLLTAISAAVAVVFACLPFYTVHDLTTMGIPLVLWAFLVLWQAAQPARTSPALIAAAYGAVLLFGACSTLAFSGYFIVGFLALFLLVQTVRRRFSGVRLLALAFAMLCALYGAANLGLVQSLFGLGGSDFVSHRTMYAPGTLAAGEIFSEFKTMLLHGQYHAGSKHFAALACAALVLAATALFWRRLEKAQKRLWLFCAGLLGGGVVIAAFYAFCGTALYARFVALLGPAVSSFQFDRLYFLYPTLWYTLLAGAVLLVVSAGPACLHAALRRLSSAKKSGAATRKTAAVSGNAPIGTQDAVSKNTISGAPQSALSCAQDAPALPRLLARAAAALMLAACFAFVLRGNYLTDNWRAVFTGQQPASAVTWRQFFSEALLSDVRAAAADTAPDGEPVVVSLGLSPAIALYNGFSTLDGYSNNYALSYHTQFGKVLRGELAKDAALASYFYDWGNRCYLFTPQLGSDFSYRRSADGASPPPLTDLAFDWNALRAMGGTHVLSIAPIDDCTQYGLTDCGKFTGSFYDLYLYKLYSKTT